MRCLLTVPLIRGIRGLSLDSLMQALPPVPQEMKMAFLRTIFVTRTCFCHPRRLFPTSSIGGVVDPCRKLNLLAVWRYNCGHSRVTSVRAGLFIAGFLAFNDVQGTELVAGILGNLDHSCRAKRLILPGVLR